MTPADDKPLLDRLAELAATVETWQDAHADAEDAAMKQLDTISSEVRALQHTIRARHERYKSELAALRYKLGEIAGEDGR